MPQPFWHGAKSILREGEEFFKDLTCIDLKAFRHRTDEDLWDNADTLELLQPQLSIDAFEQKEQGFGLNYVKGGLLWDRELRPMVRPITILTHDPTHTMFAKGVAVTELSMLIPLLNGAGCTWEHIRGFLTLGWVRPRAFRRGPALHAMFSPQRQKHFQAYGKLAAFASEALSVVAPLCHLFQSTLSIRQALPLEVDSFAKLALLCRCLNRGKFGLLRPDELEHAQYQHGEAYLRTYDGEGVSLKFHNEGKMGGQLRRDQFLMDTFPCERKHSLLKEAALPVKNTIQFERTVMARALNLHKASLAHSMHDELLQPSQGDTLAGELGLNDVVIGLDMRLDGTMYGQGDIIFDSDDAAILIRAPCKIQKAAGDAYCLAFFGYKLHAVTKVLRA